MTLAIRIVGLTFSVRGFDPYQSPAKRTVFNALTDAGSDDVFDQKPKPGHSALWIWTLPTESLPPIHPKRKAGFVLWPRVESSSGGPRVSVRSSIVYQSRFIGFSK